MEFASLSNRVDRWFLEFDTLAKRGAWPLAVRSLNTCRLLPRTGGRGDGRETGGRGGRFRNIIWPSCLIYLRLTQR
jgi:hypothetical protein